MLFIVVISIIIIINIIIVIVVIAVMFLAPSSGAAWAPTQILTRGETEPRYVMLGYIIVWYYSISV